MISLGPPNKDHLVNLFAELGNAPHSYPDVGATRGDLPIGYNVDRSSTSLGHGDAVFERARQAIREWVPFDLPWVRVVAQAEPAEGVLAAVAARVLGLWWLNVSRVIYTVDEPDRFGFAYGTLEFHAERGEELFLVEREPESGEVMYRILAFSQPRHPLARLGYPLSRRAQRRFARGSLEAMRRATN